MMDYPIVFIPGLFGSLGDDVIKGTGAFSFGFAEKIYRPFIEILNSMGYMENIDLFISYYDWKRSVLESVDKYLFPNIEMVKQKTGTDKVILIGHSLGGLLGRAYMSYFSPSSVDKLIMIGTPNLGTINAYYFWSGGKVPYSKLEDNILYNGLKAGYALYYSLFKKTNYIEGLRDMFPVVKDLLPSHSYGNYLFYKENGIRKEISVENMSINNDFLNIMEKKPIDPNKLFIVSGKGVYTNKEFLIYENIREKVKWEDGKPIKSYKTNYGDGTVTTFSTLGHLSENSTVIEGNHTNILYKSKNYLSSVLERPFIKDIKEKKVEKVYIIFANNCDKINIKTSTDNEISSRNMNITDNRIQAISLPYNSFWIMVEGDKDLKFEMTTDPVKNAKPRIYKKVVTI